MAKQESKTSATEMQFNIVSGEHDGVPLGGIIVVQDGVRWGKRDGTLTDFDNWAMFREVCKLGLSVMGSTAEEQVDGLILTPVTETEAEAYFNKIHGEG